MKSIKKPKPLRVAKRLLNSFNTNSPKTWLPSCCKDTTFFEYFCRSLDFESLNLQQAIFAFGVVIADGILIWILSKKSNLFKNLNNNA